MSGSPIVKSSAILNNVFAVLFQPSIKGCTHPRHDYATEPSMELYLLEAVNTQTAISLLACQYALADPANFFS